MEISTHNIKYENNEITFQVQNSTRKTLSIQVHPDASVIVKAPNNTKISQIKEFVNKKAKWILKHKEEFEKYKPAKKEYISGESFKFLGKQYILKVVKSDKLNISFNENRLIVETIRNTPTAVKTMLEFWYNEQAHKILKERFEICREKAEKIGLKFVGNLTIKKAKSRFGSCSSIGNITLNPILILAPTEYIDYVIMHELCHLKEMNHSKKFYDLLVKLAPNWKEYKKQLNGHIKGYLE